MVLSNTVSKDESLGRFLTDKSYFNSNGAKPKAFMPPHNLRLSVFRIVGLQIEQIWKLGEEHVLSTIPESSAGMKNIYGIADTKAFRLEKLDLYVTATDHPPRHAEICGWPEEKEKQKSIAQEIAADAETTIR